MGLTTTTIKSSGLIRALVAQGLLGIDKFNEQLEAGTASAKSVVEWLCTQGIAPPDTLAKALASHYGYPILDLAQFDFEFIAHLDHELQVANRGLEALILGRRQDTLTVALADPTDQATLQQLKFRTQLLVDPVVVEYDKLIYALGEHARANGVDEGLLTEVEQDTLNLSAIDEPDVEEAPIVRYVQRVLTDALKRGASDIHFEPYEKTYRVRFRIDGVLQETSQPPLTARTKIAARIKIMAKLNTTETRIPQDGRIRITLGTDERKVDFRVSTLPTLFGEKIVMRLLDASRSVMELSQLGLNPKQRKDIEHALSKPHGMILVTGPTGSGKTVSLYAFLHMLNEESVNISTVEDPAEINMAGINQVNINERIGLTFAKALRALLRQDPDVIMVGEIRDLETADISIKASQTGHKVLSTLHTNDAVSSIVRLRNMGVEPYNVASSLNLLIAQRLVRRLCSCKAPHPDGMHALLKLGLTETATQEDWTPFCAVGCDLCNGTGFRGRTGIYEVMPVSEAMQELIIVGASALEMEKQARTEGVGSMKDSGLEKIRAGITTVEEILAATKID